MAYSGQKKVPESISRGLKCRRSRLPPHHYHQYLLVLEDPQHCTNDMGTLLINRVFRTNYIIYFISSSHHPRPSRKHHIFRSDTEIKFPPPKSQRYHDESLPTLNQRFATSSIGFYKFKHPHHHKRRQVHVSVSDRRPSPRRTTIQNYSYDNDLSSRIITGHDNSQRGGRYFFAFDSPDTDLSVSKTHLENSCSQTPHDGSGKVVRTDLELCGSLTLVIEQVLVS
ncbi:hypothetical protein BDN72DRAFT_860676 [Pluteus cervinus]|uniref:Uncharacterized protein n=1 Tax=Pluteus cervinus TaxID=181527 RepID=A0ACD3AI59_9AGAR|nr:hypothetical protein BDN72DRAFT_860676 [Pluteus cervinus]